MRFPQTTADVFRLLQESDGLTLTEIIKHFYPFITDGDLPCARCRFRTLLAYLKRDGMAYWDGKNPYNKWHVKQ